MDTAATQESRDEVQLRLDLASAQLVLYARDLKRLLERERHKAQELAAVYQTSNNVGQRPRRHSDVDQRRVTESNGY